LKATIVVKRYNPEKGHEPYTQKYDMECNEGDKVLDVMDKIKADVDGTLTYRKNCRNAICGSCACRINGRAALACQLSVAEEMKQGEIFIEPMHNFTPIKDLIVDMKPFWDQLYAVDPWLETGNKAIPEKEFIQSKEVRKEIDASSKCIQCGACYAECNAVEVQPNFIGPAALARGATSSG